MGCRSDYLEQRCDEKYRQGTAVLLLWCLRKLCREIPAGLETDAAELYCVKDHTPELCELLKGLGPAEQSRWIYDARDPLARRLADWWEAHQQNDGRRMEAEAAALQLGTARRAARAKLTPGDLQALGLDP
jgi:hypothetical protein